MSERFKLNKKIMIFCLCTLFLTLALFSGCIDDNKEDNNGNGVIDDEETLDVDLLIYTDKKEYGVGETVNLTLVVYNNMNVSFPYGFYSLKLNYVNKSDYTSGLSYSPESINLAVLNNIKVAACENNTYNTSWVISDVDLGEYYLLFEVYEYVDESTSNIKYTTICQIKIL